MRRGSETVVTVHRFDNVLRITKQPLAMPYNFVTPSMDSASGFRWLANASIQDIITVPSLSTDDWFLFNVDQFAFYRVNYDVDNWRAIIKALKDNLQAFSEKTRAQLIDDALHLAHGGFLSYSIAFDLLMALEDETAFLPWSAVTRNLLLLRDYLQDSSAHDDFQVSFFSGLWGGRNFKWMLFKKNSKHQLNP